MALNALDDNDGIVHHEPNGKDQSQQRKRINGEAEQREERKRADQRNGNGKRWDQSRPPVLKKEVDNEDHQRKSDEKSFDDLFNAFRNRTGLIQRYGVVDVSRETLL